MQHPELAAGRWFTLSLAEQLGNIGSEVGRAIRWRERGNKEYFDAAFDRALELLDLSISDSRRRGSKLRELVRVREALCETFFGDPHVGGSFASWNKYFFYFALLARS